MKASPLRIVFMGTPDFAVPSLEILIKNGYDIVAVVTAPDRHAGRGLKLLQSPIKQFALENNIPVLQPEKLKAPEFLIQLKACNADLQIVVAFRMLPEVVWNMPPRGTFNLHASLLPQYRGAAPINWAIINGEIKSGVTTFFLKHEIDTGDIIMQQEVSIGENTTAGELHDKLMHIGAGLVLETASAIDKGEVKAFSQPFDEEIKHAPKIFRDDCRINWNLPLHQLHNFIRGLSPYPAAFTSWEGKNMKIIRTSPEPLFHENTIGEVLSDDKSFVKVAVEGGFLHVLELQPEGKKPMPVKAFLAGNKVSGKVLG